MVLTLIHSSMKTCWQRLDVSNNAHMPSSLRHSADFDFPFRAVAMEARVLGGHFAVYDGITRPTAQPLRQHREAGRRNKSRLEGIPVLWRWPCVWKANQYMSEEDDLALWARQGWKTVAPKHDLAYRVYPEDIALYFTNGFWTGRPRILNMKFRATVAALFSPGEDGSFRPVEPNNIQRIALGTHVNLHEFQNGRPVDDNTPQGADEIALDLRV